jgi:hypothetical protein
VATPSETETVAELAPFSTSHTIVMRAGDARHPMLAAVPQARPLHRAMAEVPTDAWPAEAPTVATDALLVVAAPTVATDACSAAPTVASGAAAVCAMPAVEASAASGPTTAAARPDA